MSLTRAFRWYSNFVSTSFTNLRMSSGSPLKALISSFSGLRRERLDFRFILFIALFHPRRSSFIKLLGGVSESEDDESESLGLTEWELELKELEEELPSPGSPPLATLGGEGGGTPPDPFSAGCFSR